jgi:hypothetical protein
MEVLDDDFDKHIPGREVVLGTMPQLSSFTFLQGTLGFRVIEAENPVRS